MDIETKNFNFEVKASNDDDMTFEGYGSIFGNLDSYRDIVEKGAFTRTIKNNKNRIKILWQHDTWKPIGKPIQLQEDDKGLFLKAKISDTEQGREAYTLMKDGVLNEMSIGYNTIKHEYDKEKDIRYLKEIKLFEVSLVTFAANPKATVNNVKSEFDNLALELKSLRESLSNMNKMDSKSIYDLLLDEIKSGKLINDTNNNNDKISNLIKALQALIINDDSSKDTHIDNNSQKDINDTDSIIIDNSESKENDIFTELLQKINTEFK
jgi:HK97 family phage prohead protease